MAKRTDSYSKEAIRKSDAYRAMAATGRYDLTDPTIESTICQYAWLDDKIGECRRILDTEGLMVEGLHLDMEFKRCTVDGTEVKLTRKEFELLAYLISHRGRVCSREQILSRVWSDEVVVLDRTIDVNITRVRQKIGPYGAYIVTKSGYGYGFRD